MRAPSFNTPMKSGERNEVRNGAVLRTQENEMFLHAILIHPYLLVIYIKLQQTLRPQYARIKTASYLFNFKAAEDHSCPASKSPLGSYAIRCKKDTIL
jgi:hypothetical protein